MELIKDKLNHLPSIHLLKNHNDAFYLYISHALFSMVKWLHTYSSELYIQNNDPTGIYIACINNHFTIANWLYDHYPNTMKNKDMTHLFDILCKKGQLEMARWLSTKSVFINLLESDQAFVNATQGNHLELLKWLVERNLQCNPDELHSSYNWNYQSILRSACKCGHIEIAQWILSITPIFEGWITSQLLVITLMENQVKCANWLCEVKPKILEELTFDQKYIIINHCLVEGHLDAIKWIHPKYIFEIDAVILVNICKRGHLHIAQFISDSEDPIDYFGKDPIFYFELIAIHSSENLDFVQWFYEKYHLQFDCNISDLCARLIRFTSHHVIEYIWSHCKDHSKKLSIDDDTYIDLFQKGNLPMLQWIFHQDLRPSSEIFEYGVGSAILSNHLPIVKWIMEDVKEEGPHSNSMIDLESALLSASTEGYVDMAMYLFDKMKKDGVNCYLLNIVFMEFCHHHHFEFAKWFYNAVKESCKVNIDLQTAHNQYDEQDAHEYENWGKDRSPFASALKYGDLHFAQWLLKRAPEINIQIEYYMDNYFYSLSSQGKLEFAQWLYHLNPSALRRNDNSVMIIGESDIDESDQSDSDEVLFTDYEETFMAICQRGYLKVAQWFYSLFPHMNLSIDNDILYRRFCANGEVQMIEWFRSLRPEKFDYCIDQYGQYVPIIHLVITKEKCMECPETIECSICMEHSAEIVTQCNHVYCKSCIMGWIDSLGNTEYHCPYCRKRLTEELLYKIV